MLCRVQFFENYKAEISDFFVCLKMRGFESCNCKMKCKYKTGRATQPVEFEGGLNHYFTYSIFTRISFMARMFEETFETWSLRNWPAVGVCFLGSEYISWLVNPPPVTYPPQK